MAPRGASKLPVRAHHANAGAESATTEGEKPARTNPSSSLENAANEASPEKKPVAKSQSLLKAAVKRQLQAAPSPSPQSVGETGRSSPRERFTWAEKASELRQQQRSEKESSVNSYRQARPENQTPAPASAVRACVKTQLVRSPRKRPASPEKEEQRPQKKNRTVEKQPESAQPVDELSPPPPPPPPPQAHQYNTSLSHGDLRSIWAAFRSFESESESESGFDIDGPIQVPPSHLRPSLPQLRPTSPTMAPTPTSGAGASLRTVETHLSTIIQSYYTLLVSVHGFIGPDSADNITNTIGALVDQFTAVSLAANATGVRDIAFPQEVIQYVEDGRNPDIYTREFVEMAQKENQYTNGKIRAFRSFRDELAEQVVGAFPELKDDVERICDNTGAKMGTWSEENEAAAAAWAAAAAGVGMKDEDKKVAVAEKKKVVEKKKVANGNGHGR